MQAQFAVHDIQPMAGALKIIFRLRENAPLCRFRFDAGRKRERVEIAETSNVLMNLQVRVLQRLFRAVNKSVDDRPVLLWLAALPLALFQFALFLQSVKASACGAQLAIVFEQFLLLVWQRRLYVRLFVAV